MFKDRKEAGVNLSKRLKEYEGKKDVIVIGLPRGGVVLAYQISKKLKLPLDVIAPRKISMPGSPEAAIGAITPDGQKVFDWTLISEVGIERDYIDNEIEKEKREGERRLKIYRAGKPKLELKDKIVILVDDGVATGSTMSVSIKSVRAQNAKKIIIAVPVAPQSFLEKIKSEVDQIICLEVPEYFVAIGQFYKSFDQVEDDQVIDLLR